MRRTDIAHAMDDTVLLLERMRAARRELSLEGREYYGDSGTPTSGALRRQSMEVTRALARMRRP